MKMGTSRAAMRWQGMTTRQGDLFGADDLPEGLTYMADFLSPEQESELLGHIESLSFKPFEFQGFLGKREVISFGWSYGFDGSGLAPAPAIPSWLLPARTRAAAFARLEPALLQQALLIRYGEGAGLGWHRDRPVFDDVIGISLLAPAPLRFRHKAGAKWRRFTQRVDPRSIYLLRGEARRVWEHSIPPVEALRYAITFRTMAASA
jgi:alkylated DNA repair protein (DNA oxidative demethylase)